MTRDETRSRLLKWHADTKAHLTLLSRLLDSADKNLSSGELLSFGGLSLQTIVIFDGIPSEPGEFPEVCALYDKRGLVGTGVVVAEKRVLTAGHVADFELIDVVFPLDNTNIAPPLTAHHRVTQAARKADADLAVVTIDNPFPLAFPPARVGSLAAFNAAKAEGVVMVGFGNATADESQSTYGVKRKSGRLTIVGDGPIPGIGIPAAIEVGANPQAVCTKDSGGPLYLAGSHPPVLVGIAFERPNTAGPLCGRASVFLRTDIYADWINHQL